MARLSDLRKGHEVLLKNGKLKVYGIEKVNKKDIRAIKLKDKWTILVDYRTPLSDILNFLSWNK